MSCFPFIRSGQNHLARHSERGKKTRKTEKEVGTQHQGMDRLDFAKSQRAVENREKWRELVAKSSVVLQRPPAAEGNCDGDDMTQKGPSWVYILVLVVPVNG